MAAVTKKCIRCSKPSFSRGVCFNHYHKVYRAVRSGEIKSWQHAERDGLAVAKKQKPGPKVCL